MNRINFAEDFMVCARCHRVVALSFVVVAAAIAGAQAWAANIDIKSPPASESKSPALPIVSTPYTPRDVDPPIVASEADRKGHELALRVLAALRERESHQNAYYGTDRITEAERLLAAATNEEDRLKMNLRLTFAEMDLGLEDAALAHMITAQKQVNDTRERMHPGAVAELHFMFGMINLRHGETQNCCLLHNKDSCLMPIRGGGIHTRKAGAQSAIDELKQVMAIAPPGSDRYLEAAWLWNLAAMSLGEFPDAVPETIRFKSDRFLSQEKFPRFMNIAEELKLDTNSLCGSVVADDFNNDGYLDLMVSSWDVRDPLKFYLNDAKGGFIDRTHEANLDGIPGGLNMVQADYDNDGRLDVFIMRGAWLFGAGKHPYSLLRNNGDGTFTDVTFPAGLGEENYPGQAAGWADYDLDGRLDLFIGGEEGPQNRAPCRLFHNNGNGTFTDVTPKAGVATHMLVKGCIWGDFNNDRFPDIFVSTLGSPTNAGALKRLYRNNHDGTFTDVAADAGVANMGGATFPTWFWDYNNDGVQDLFVAAFHATTAQVARYYMGETMDAGMPHVFRGSSDGKFVEVTKELGLAEPTLVMGCNFGDLNNDGWLDMYLGTGSPDYKMIIPNKLYLNHEGKRFADVSEAAGMAHLQKGHGVAFADLDGDGDQDLFEQMGGAYPVDKFVDALFENPGFGNNFVSVELVGVKSNRFGVGSRIRVDVEEGGTTRSIYKWVNSGGSFGCNSMRQQIGVGQATHVKRIEVYWPASDTTQSFEDLTVNGIVRITEGSNKAQEMGLPPTEFARTRPTVAKSPAIAAVSAPPAPQ